jgi:class 3 adenylate cyclase/tetratricopeptide (TPR) repeat protein
VGEASAAGSLHTFLFADIRGYTRFTAEHGDAAAVRLAAKFAGVVREVASGRGGEVIELRGDEALAVFVSVHAALWAAIELQDRLMRESQADPTLPLHVGVGIEVGEAIPFEAGYRGGVLNLAARLCALAGPGEVLTSDGVAHLARNVEGLQYTERGFAHLKGFTEPIRVIEVKPSVGQPESSRRGEMPSLPGLLKGHSSVEGVISGEGLSSHLQKLPIGGFLGALPSGPLVGREEELRKILSAVDVVANGSGQLVLLSGEPGVGKTRLAQEATLHLRNRGFRVAVGRCYDGDQSVAYHPFREALETLYVACSAAIRSAVAAQWPDVQLLLPGHSNVPPSAVSHGEEEARERLFWSVTGFVCAASAEAPVAMLLDDVHWADGSSMALLQHLTEQTRNYPVLLVGTYRDVDVDRHHPLVGILRDLYREQLLYRIEVRRLGREATAALVAEAMGEAEAGFDLGEDFAVLVHRWTEGNPFFVQQLLRVLVERGDVRRQDGHWMPSALEEIEVPESVRSVIRQRLSRLNESTQQIMIEASVLGQAFGFDDLQAMGDRDERGLEAALEEAGETGLIREAGPDGYAFDHALTQQTLYSELSARRKRRFHLAAAEALEKVSDRHRERRAAEIAQHFIRGGEEERALPYSMLAGDEAEVVFAHGEAEWHYRSALEGARASGDMATEAEAMGKLGRVLFSLGKVKESLNTLDAAAGAYKVLGGSDREMEVLAQAAWTLFELGRRQDGIDRLVPALERWRKHETPSAAAASLHIALASLYWANGRAAEALPLADTASQIARAAGDRRLLGDAEGRRGLALIALGRTDEGLGAYGEAITLADATGDLANLTRTLNNRAVSHGDRGDAGAEWADMESGLDAARRMGSPIHIAWSLVHMGEVARLEGDWDLAEERFEEAVQVLREVRATRAFAKAELAGLRMLRGSTSAPHDLEELTATGEHTGNVPLYLRAQHWLAEFELLHGRPGVARERIQAVLAHPGLENQYRAESQWTMAQALLALGEVDAAGTLIDDELGQATRSRDLAAWSQLQGCLRARQARWEEASRAFDDALRWALRCGHMFRRGLTLREIGLMHAAREEPDAARTRLDEALAIFRRLEARTHAEQTEAAIAGLGS